MIRYVIAAGFVVLSACSSDAPRDGSAAVAETRNEAATPARPSPAPEPSIAAEEPPPHAGPSAEAAAEAGPLAAALTRREWRRAENRRDCAPIVLTTHGGAPATGRRANFAGGWAVAFDRPGLRSAYGVAGVGLIPVDQGDAAEQEDRLRGQWPYFMDLPALPAPSFAGYGLEGAQPYRAEAPDGIGDHSLAYVRVGGQTCTYNVWSRLGRAHLEALLMSLRRL